MPKLSDYREAIRILADWCLAQDDLTGFGAFLFESLSAESRMLTVGVRLVTQTTKVASVDEPKRRVSRWHSLFFWGSLLVAGTLFLARLGTPNGPIPHLFDRDTRNMIRQFHVSRQHRIVKWLPALFQLERPSNAKPSR